MYSLNTERTGNTLIASPAGRIDGDNAMDFKAALEEHIQPGDSVILDLKDLAYMSSAGLRVLAILASKSAKTPFGLCLCAAAENVDYVLRTSGFDKLITIHETMQDATAS